MLDDHLSTSDLNKPAAKGCFKIGLEALKVQIPLFPLNDDRVTVAGMIPFRLSDDSWIPGNGRVEISDAIYAKSASI